MSEWTFQKILHAAGGEWRQGGGAGKIRGFSTDTRTLKPGEFFIALSGPRHDGHDHVGEAAAQGACGALVRNRWKVSKELRDAFPLIGVGDVLGALGEMARFHRSSFDLPVVGVTGSCGKTTTKEMISKVLESRWRVLKSAGTENNSIGVPRTLLRLWFDHDAVVSELGMNHPGEIERLAGILQPTMGILTNIGPAHLAGVGSLERIYRAKLEMLEHLRPGGTLLVNGDDPFLQRLRTRRFRIVRYGVRSPGGYRATEIEVGRNGVRFRVDGRSRVVLRAHGFHQVYNALAAFAAGRELGLSRSRAIEALESFRPLAGRMQIVKRAGVTWINDAYNANPTSTGMAIDTLERAFAGKRKAVVLGDMLELGPKTEEFHRRIGERVARLKPDLFLAVGRHMKEAARSAQKRANVPLRCFDGADEAGRFLRSWLAPGDVVLVKGSHRLNMQQVIRCCTSSSIL